MRAVVVSQAGSVGLETVHDPVPQGDEAIVKVLGCGICGTDLHIVHEGLPTVRFPLIPGHEPYGEIVDLGLVRTGALRVGDRVSIDPSLHCGVCPRCQEGRGNLCERWGAIGATKSGAWSDFVAVPRRNMHVLTEDFPIDCAPIIEPVACALRGIVQLKPQLDRSALIFGAGTMGMLLALLLDIQGVGPITMVEINEQRRRIASQFLPAKVIRPEELGDLRAHHVIDATGDPQAIESALQHVAYGGTVLLFGVSSPTTRVKLLPFDIYEREFTVVSSKAILNTFSVAIDTVRRHSAVFLPLISRPGFRLEEFQDALDVLQSGSAVKVFIQPNA